MTNKNNTLNKKSIFKRIYQQIDLSLSYSWDNLIIVLLSSFLLYILVVLIGLMDLHTNITLFEVFKEFTRPKAVYLKQFFMVEVFIILFVLRKVPLKIMANQVIVFGIFLSIAVLSTFLCKINVFLYVLVSLVWIIVFIYTQQSEFFKPIGLFTVISYVFYLTLIIPLDDYNLFFVINSTILIFVNVLIVSIAMFVVRLLQHDPFKKELISSLFNKENGYYEFNEIKKSILKFDKSDYTKGMINIAEELFVYNININNLSLNLNYKEEIDDFIVEVDRLIEKIKFAINNSLDDWFEVNISRITEFYKDYQLKNQVFINYMMHKYKTVFEKLNDLFARKSFNDDSIFELSFNEKLKHHEYKYSLRFICVILICFMWDYLNKNWMFTATLISFFTLTLNLIFNSNVFLIRVYAVVMSVIVGVGILLLSNFFNITFIIFPLCVFVFILYFLFKDNTYIACFLFLLGFILWTPKNIVNTCMLFTFNSILSLGVIIIVFNLIMPEKSENNLIKLFVYKLDLTKKSISEFYNEGFEEDTLDKLRENNEKICDTINKVNRKYTNTVEDTRLFSSLNQLLDDYGNKINSIKLIFDEENLEYDYGKILGELELVLDSFKNILEEKEVDRELEVISEFENISFNLKEVINSDERIKFIHPILMSIVLDVDEIYSILMRLKNEELIKKYNKSLIKNVFNIKDFY